MFRRQRDGIAFASIIFIANIYQRAVYTSSGGEHEPASYRVL